MEKLQISQNRFKLAKTSWIWQLRQSSTRLEQYQMSCGKHTSMMWVSSFKFIERHSYQMSSLLVHILSGWKKLSMTRPKLKQSTMNNFTKIEVSQPRNQQGKPSWSQRSLPSQSVSSFKDVPNARKRSYKLHAQEQMWHYEGWKMSSGPFRHMHSNSRKHRERAVRAVFI